MSPAAGKPVGKRKGEGSTERVTETQTDMPTGCFIVHWENINMKLQTQ